MSKSQKFIRDSEMAKRRYQLVKESAEARSTIDGIEW